MLDALRFFPRLPPGCGPVLIACLFAGRQPEDSCSPCSSLCVDGVLLLSVLMVGSASGGLDTGHTGSASAMAWAPCCLLAVLVFAGVVIRVGMGGGVISAAPRSLAGPARPAPRILSVRWANEGWS
jgi:hypothetical protein